MRKELYVGAKVRRISHFTANPIFNDPNRIFTVTQHSTRYGDGSLTKIKISFEGQTLQHNDGWWFSEYFELVDNTSRKASGFKKFQQKIK